MESHPRESFILNAMWNSLPGGKQNPKGQLGSTHRALGLCSMCLAILNEYWFTYNCISLVRLSKRKKQGPFSYSAAYNHLFPALDSTATSNTGPSTSATAPIPIPSGPALMSDSRTASRSIHAEFSGGTPEGAMELWEPYINLLHVLEDLA